MDAWLSSCCRFPLVTPSALRCAAWVQAWAAGSVQGSWGDLRPRREGHTRAGAWAGGQACSRSGPGAGCSSLQRDSHTRVARCPVQHGSARHAPPPSSSAGRCVSYRAKPTKPRTPTLCSHAPPHTHTQAAPYVMFYRRDVFERDNLTVPQTWEEFTDLAERYHGGSDGLNGACIMSIGGFESSSTRFDEDPGRDWAGGRRLRHCTSRRAPRQLDRQHRASAPGARIGVLPTGTQQMHRSPPCPQRASITAAVPIPWH